VIVSSSRGWDGPERTLTNRLDPPHHTPSDSESSNCGGVRSAEAATILACSLPRMPPVLRFGAAVGSALSDQAAARLIGRFTSCPAVSAALWYRIRSQHLACISSGRRRSFYPDCERHRFLPNSTVMWGETPRATASLSPTQLKAAISAIASISATADFAETDTCGGSQGLRMLLHQLRDRASVLEPTRSRCRQPRVPSR
jgi:hypothetical protein